jgi:hypothetical protein
LAFPNRFVKIGHSLGIRGGNRGHWDCHSYARTEVVMTKEKEIAVAVPQTDKKDTLVSSEKSMNVPTDSSRGANVRDDKDRRVIIFASILLIALAMPVFLPVQGERSLWQMTRYDSMGRVLICAILGWPVCLGLIGIVQGLRKNAPEKALLVIATTLTAIQTLAGVALTAMCLAFERRAAESPFVWLAAASTVLAVGTVVRSFFCTGWQRLQHLMVPIALLALLIVLLIAGIERSAVERVSDGGWAFLFATAALVPFVARTLASRRN